MAKIKESLRLPFGNRIIKLQDVYEIAKILKTEYEKANSKKVANCRLNFTVICENGPTYESSDIDIFESESIINSKKPNKIELRFSNYKDDDYIRVSLRREYNSSYSENYINVEGFDSTWVNGVLGRINQRIDSTEPQNSNKKLYLNLIFFASVVLIGRIFTIIILLIPGTPDESKMGAASFAIRQFIHTNDFTYYFSIYLIGFLVGILPAFSIKNFFRKFWPYLEIQIGPNHKMDEIKNRQILNKWILTIVVPLLLMILYDIIKLF